MSSIDLLRRVTGPRLRRLRNEGIWVVLCQVATVLAALALVRAQTYYLDPAQLGEFVLTITTGTLVAQVTLFVVAPGIARYYAVAAESGYSRSYPANVRRIIGTASLAAVGLLGLALAVLLLSGQDQWLLSTFLAGLVMIVSGIGTAWSGLFTAARARAIAGLHGAADPLLRLTFLLAIVALLGSGITQVLLAYLVAVTVLFGSQYYFAQRLLNRFTFDTNQDFLGKIWIYSRPFIAINLLAWIQAAADRWALQTFASTQDVGLLSVLIQLGVTPISMAVGVMTVFVSPILYNRMGDGSDLDRRSSARRLAFALLFFSAGLTAMATFIAAIGHELIFSLLVAPDYRTASYLLPWAAGVGGLLSCAQVLSVRLMSELRTDLLTLPKFVTSVLSVVLGAAFAYFWGLDGIVFAMLVHSTAHVVWLMAVLPR